MNRMTASVLVLFVLAGAARAEVIIDADTTLDYTIHDVVRVVAGANPPTTVQFVEPGDVNNMAVYDDSIVNMTDGYVGGYLQGYGSSTLNVSGGTFGLGLDVHDQSTLNVSGGASELLYVYDESMTDFSGGYYELVSAHGSARLDVRGGADMSSLAAGLAARINVFGGHIGGELWAYGTSIITVYGTGFNYPYGEIPDPSGTLTGTLADGSPVNTRFDIRDDGVILLVPEPSTLVLLSLGAVALPVCLRRKRKR